MMWTAVDEVDTELCIRSYKGMFKTQIADDTMYCYNSGGTTYYRASEICLLLAYFLCKLNINSGKQETVLYCCPPEHTPLPLVLQRLNVLRSECLRNIYWHLLVHGLTFQALFAVFKCQHFCHNAL